MDLPFFSKQQLWQQLSNSTVGFYTSKTKANIPNSPGIYAWILPLELSDSLSDVIKTHKKYYSYDPSSKGVFTSNSMLRFQWQSFSVTTNAVEDYSYQKTIEEKWKRIQSEIDPERSKSISQLFALSSIFTKPLYIGLTKNLSARYEQHTTQNSNANSFFKRFSDFQISLDANLRIDELLFVAIPVKLGNDPKLDDDVISILEYLLKNVVGPVYGEK